jgi:hypothetical protein
MAVTVAKMETRSKEEERVNKCENLTKVQLPFGVCRYSVES